MTRAICSTVAAAALMVASLGAQAAVETLGFEALGAQVAATAKLNRVDPITGAPDPKYGTPIAVGSQQGFAFSGAYAYEHSTADPTASATPAIPQGVPTPVNGYIANRMETGLPGPITLDLDPGNVGNYLLSLSFDLFVASTAIPTLSWYSGDVRINSATFTPGLGSKFWAGNGPLSFLATDRVNKLVFNADVDRFTTGGGTFGLDNIKVEFVAGNGSGPNPNPVPEPASYGLVALALLGAGLASRRRKA